LYRKISGREPIYAVPSNKSLRTVFLTVGSLARWFCEDSIVWGAGVIDYDEPKWRPFETLAVRGPYTRQQMVDRGFSCPDVYGDPAILMPMFYRPSLLPTYELGIVPHYCNYAEACQIFSGDPSVKVVDVRSAVESVINDLLACRRIVSSSLHGLILAHAYGLPAAWIEFSKRPDGSGVKFLDYFASASGRTPEPPLVVRQGMHLDEMFGYIRQAVQPNLEPLRAPLLAACPFPRNLAIFG
jgi:hypothetical protein